MKAMLTMARERARATAMLEFALHILIFLSADLTFGISLLQDRKRRFGLTHLGAVAPGASVEFEA